MNGKKARTVRKLFGVKHVRLVPYAERYIIPYVRREKRPQY